MWGQGKGGLLVAIEIYFYNQYLAQKIALETLAYSNGSKMKKKIGLTCIILGQHKAIKKFLEINKIGKVYIKEMEEI